MKQLLPFFSIFILAVASLSGCKQDTTSTGNPVIPMTTSTTTANPVLCYVGSSSGQPTIAVMNADATNKTNINTLTSGHSVNLNYVTWSAPNSSGNSSIAWVEYSSGTYTLKAIDVSVNSNGVPVGNNLRTIYAPAVSDSVVIYYPRWSQTASTDQIAFIRSHVNKINGTSADRGLSELCTITESGIISVVATVYGSGTTKKFWYPCWSPDDSKIALSHEDTVLNGNAQFTLEVYNVSDGSKAASIDLANTYWPSSLSWSHSGSNYLAYPILINGQGSSSKPSPLYYCAPTNGSTPTTNNVRASWACWSPDNSKLLLKDASNPLKTVVAFGTTETTVSSTNFPPIDWKQ